MIENLRGVRGLLGLALVAVSAIGLGSCAGDEVEPAGMFSEPCSTGPNACVSGLTCVAGLCTVSCLDNAPCLPYSATAICDTYCYLPCPTNQCPTGLTCSNFASTKFTCRLHH
jgi:hypothetical protein